MGRTMGRVATLLLLAALGCASGSASRAGGLFGAPSQSTTVRIVVQNRNFQDARLFTHRLGGRAILGMVGAKVDREFVLDWDIPEPLYIEIDMLTGPRCFTDELIVDPGDVLELQIAPEFSRTMGCRPR